MWLSEKYPSTFTQDEVGRAEVPRVSSRDESAHLLATDKNAIACRENIRRRPGGAKHESDEEDLEEQSQPDDSPPTEWDEMLSGSYFSVIGVSEGSEGAISVLLVCLRVRRELFQCYQCVIGVSEGV